MCASENMGRVSRARRIYEDIILRSGGGVSEFARCCWCLLDDDELDSRLIYILHSVSTNTLYQKKGEKGHTVLVVSGTKKNNQFLCCSFERKITLLKEKKRDKREWEKEEKDTFIITLFFFSSG